MEAKASVKNVRISTRKVRLVVDLIRGKKVKTALEYLEFTSKKGVPVVKKLIESAVANAQNNLGVEDIDSLVVGEAYVNEGATLKRFRPRAMGRASKINKRTSHITVVLKN